VDSPLYKHLVLMYALQYAPIDDIEIISPNTHGVRGMRKKCTMDSG
jgi:hypothetical protein